VNDFAEGPCNRENVFSKRVTGFHRRPKVFEVNFFIRKTFLTLSKPGRQNHPHSRSICPLPGPL